MAAFVSQQTEISVNHSNDYRFYNCIFTSFSSSQTFKHTVSNLDVFTSNNVFARLYNKFNAEFSEKKEFLEIANTNSLLENVKRNLSLVLELNPSKTSIEISNENSFIITFRLNGLLFFLEQYFYHSDDELFVNIYEGKRSLKSFDGQFNVIQNYLKEKYFSA
jgi:hypothetical protein